MSATRHHPYICMGLARLIGMILASTISIWVFLSLNKTWHLGVSNLADLSSQGSKAYIAAFLAMGAGLIGVVIGQGIGASIKVKSDAVAANINIAWHYLANTSIGWSMISIITVSVSLGQVGARAFMEEAGLVYTIAALIIAAIGSQVISFSLTIGGHFFRRGNVDGAVLFTRAVPVLVPVGMAILQSWLFGLNTVVMGVLAFFMPFILIPTCAQMWRKDMAMREQ